MTSEMIWEAAAVYVLVLSVLTFVVYGLDKRKAKKGAWRTPESTLLLLAAAGGSLGALAAMKCFRHKTQHAKFVWGVPAIIVAQAALAVWVVWF